MTSNSSTLVINDKGIEIFMSVYQNILYSICDNKLY